MIRHLIEKIYLDQRSEDTFENLRLSVILVFNLILVAMGAFLALDAYSHNGLIGLIPAGIVSGWCLANLLLIKRVRSRSYFYYSSIIAGASAISAAVLLFGGLLTNSALIFTLPLVLVNFILFSKRHALLNFFLILMGESILAYFTINSNLAGPFREGYLTNLFSDLVLGQVICAALGVFFFPNPQCLFETN